MCSITLYCSVNKSACLEYSHPDKQCPDGDSMPRIFDNLSLPWLLKLISGELRGKDAERFLKDRV